MACLRSALKVRMVVVDRFDIEQVKGYTIMPNYHQRDRTLSIKAKGILSQMFSLPEGWDYHPNIGGDGHWSFERIGNQLFPSLRQCIVDYIADAGNGQSHRGILCMNNVTRNIFDDAGNCSRLLGWGIEKIVNGEV